MLKKCGVTIPNLMRSIQSFALGVKGVFVVDGVVAENQ